jgi:anti-sigma regulatory factor (Ser/Thr protein kinase)
LPYGGIAGEGRWHERSFEATVVTADIRPGEGATKTPAQQRVVLTIPTKPEFVALGRLALTALGNQAGLEEETIADLKLAVSEACATFIAEPGSESAFEMAGSGGGGTIRIEYSLMPDRWTILVQGPDTGVRLDARTDDPLSECAIGITIICALVDEVSLEHDGNQATLRMVKRL